MESHGINKYTINKHTCHKLEEECEEMQFVIMSAKGNLDICYQIVWEC